MFKKSKVANLVSIIGGSTVIVIGIMIGDAFSLVAPKAINYSDLGKQQVIQAATRISSKDKRVIRSAKRDIQKLRSLNKKLERQVAKVKSATAKLR